MCQYVSLKWISLSLELRSCRIQQREVRKTSSFDFNFFVLMWVGFSVERVQRFIFFKGY
jgi:hypothetical protein